MIFVILLFQQFTFILIFIAGKLKKFAPFNIGQILLIYNSYSCHKMVFSLLLCACVCVCVCVSVFLGFVFVCLYLWLLCFFFFLHCVVFSVCVCVFFFWCFVFITANKQHKNTLTFQTFLALKPKMKNTTKMPFFSMRFFLCFTALFFFNFFLFLETQKKTHTKLTRKHTYKHTRKHTYTAHKYKHINTHA